jgi:SAM-dependent methyltransferase
MLASLIRESGPGNLAHVMQFLPLLAGVEDYIVGCFRTGGGVPYSAYPRFHQLMADDSALVFDSALIDLIIPLVSGLTERLRSGIDVADLITAFDAIHDQAQPGRVLTMISDALRPDGVFLMIDIRASSRLE